MAELTHKYGGLLWGEHGKGVRSEYAPKFFGELYPSLQRVKAAFDPHNQLNPGKIATPSIPPDAAKPSIPPEAAGTASTTSVSEDTVKWVDPGLLTIDGVPTRGQLDRQIDERAWQAHAATVYCNGNGACYNYDPDDAMCPSWKATRDRIHSPKGRASLVREWLRLQGKAGIDLVEESRKKKREGCGASSPRSRRGRATPGAAAARPTFPMRSTTPWRAAWPASPAPASARSRSTCRTRARSSSRSTTAATCARCGTT